VPPKADFWRGRRVLLTGHTGFKGSWALLWLAARGADVTGLSLPPESEPALFDLVDAERRARSYLVDLRDRAAVAKAVAAADPEIVLHLAAQALVRRSYAEPVETFASNVMGTVHLLDALRGAANLRTVLVVTTDKVYENDESGRAFVESDRLGGHDPYAASKAATEIVVASYAASFLREKGVRVATARGGNVIGGGDFSQDRLVPDIVRAAMHGAPVTLRQPGSTRPWQHVLDCLAGYFRYVEALDDGEAVPSALNFGPSLEDGTLTVAEVAAAMGEAFGNPGWVQDVARMPHEMASLSIDPDLARRVLGFRSRHSSREAIRLTAEWYAAWRRGEDVAALTRAQIAAYEALEESVT